MTDPLTIPCPGCGATLARVEVFEQDRVQFDLYRCNEGKCARKAVVLYEPGTAFTAEEQGLVQQEIGRRGSFFPSDFTGSRKLGRLG